MSYGANIFASNDAGQVFLPPQCLTHMHGDLLIYSTLDPWTKISYLWHHKLMDDTPVK